MHLKFLLLLSLSVLSFSPIKTSPPTVNNKIIVPGDGAYPTPPPSDVRLFYIQRTPNTNTIGYDLNLENNGKPTAEEPVKGYWIRYAENGQKEDLNYIQRKF